MSPTRRSVLAAAPLLASAAGFASPATSESMHSDVATKGDSRALALRAAHAHEALMRGDLNTYRSLILMTDDFTLMAPFGGRPTRGAELSNERWEAIGRFFKNGKASTLELVESYPSADLVVLVAVERTHVEVGTVPGQDWALRVTLVFRKEDGQWRLAHRHADPLVEGISVDHAAALARGAVTG